jgi:hypothetical protein
MSISPNGQQYLFRVQGPGGRDATATLPRACTGTSHWLQWAGGFYFGGTSTAPTQITGQMNEVR